MKYLNVECPVCSKKFDKDDNVVVCPKCGTPHHRECYEKLGHCVNQEKHSENFSWQSPIQPEEPEKVTPKTQGVKIDNKMIKFPKDMDPKEAEEMLKMVGYRKLEPHEMLDDVSVEDYGTYVDKNKHKYLPKFYKMSKTGSKMSLNWSAFFFPIPWLFYRKMIKLGVFLSIILCIVPAVFAKDMVDYTNNLMDKVSSSSADATIADVRENVEDPPLAYTATSYITFAISLFGGLFGNYFYMKKARKDILAIKGSCKDKNQCDILLKKKGSTSIWIMVLYLAMFYGLLNLAFFQAEATGVDLSVYLDKFVTWFRGVTL